MWGLHRVQQVSLLLRFLAFISVASAQQSHEQIPLSSYSGNNTNACDEACTSLLSILGSEKIHYNGRGEAPLPASLFAEYYSSRQKDVRPLCLAVPTSVEDVAEVMKVVSRFECTFAAKSGGHSMFPGAASAPDGISIDLKLLNGLSISEDRETVSVGTGNRWKAVYAFLDPFNLTAVGGRAGFVGVGGFLLGGGISYISRKYGWGADNVRNFELVLANGSISNVNYSTHPDLYWALRGGGSNFGIVTRFDLETHPQGLAHGDFNGMLISPSTISSPTPLITPSLVSSILQKAITLTISLACNFGFCTSPDAFSEQLWRTLEGSKDDPSLQLYGYFCLLHYGDVAGFHMFDGRGREDVEAYREVKAGRKIVSLPKTEAISWFADDLTVRSENWGTRNSYETLSFKDPSLEVIKELVRMFIEEFGDMRRMSGVICSLPVMFITADEISHMTKNGGNPLGLKAEDGPLLLINAALTYPTADLDEIMLRKSNRFIERATAMGKEKGVYHDYKYMNYASKNQDVFAGYGVENRRRLREIQLKYDVKDVFHRLQAGYFKV